MELGDLLRGRWLGHPVHPALTDLPIGFWSSAFFLDFAGVKAAPAADAFVAAGVATAVPTIATGLAELGTLPTGHPARRVAVAHAASNSAATALYAASWLARRRGDRGQGVALGMTGAAVATFGAYLGGHLVFRHGVGSIVGRRGAERPD